MNDLVIYSNDLENWSVKQGVSKRSVDKLCSHANLRQFYEANLQQQKSIPNLQREQQYREQIVAGVDEAGRGPLAGPVVAAAVIIRQDCIIQGINDSKKLTRCTRESLYDKIVHNYLWAVGIVSAEEIDEINILMATKKACELAVANLGTVDVVLVDGNMKFKDSRFISIINGDNLSISIAAASIIAKVTRDNLMLELDRQFPEYFWHQNVGYGTKQHINAIKQYGLSPYHRKSFRIK